MFPVDISTRSRAGKISTAIEYSGLSRSRLYELAQRYPTLFRKNGNATIVDFNVLDRVIDDLPLAELKASAA